MESLKFIRNHNRRDIVVCSDSLSALKALDFAGLNPKYHPLILQIKSLYNRIIFNNRDIQFDWCPSHCGITGNENTENLAVLGRDSGLPLKFEALPAAIARHSMQQFDLREAESRSASFLSKGLAYKLLGGSGAKSACFVGLNLPRDAVTLINRMRAGHLGTNEHLFRIGLANSPLCDCGLDIQGMNHIFWA